MRSAEINYRILTMIFILIILPIGAQSATDSNLVLNPGFELGSSTPLNWHFDSNNPDTLDTLTWDYESYTGLRSIKISIPGRTQTESGYVESDLIEVEPNQIYILSAWGKTESIGGSNLPAVIIEEFDANKKFLGKSSLPEFERGTNDWKIRSGEIKTRSKTTYVDVYAIIKQGYGTFWVDDITLELKNAPVPSATPTSSPSATPTSSPSATPTSSPSASPTSSPSASPTSSPSATPPSLPALGITQMSAQNITINNGDEYTNSTEVILNLISSGGSMSFSNDNVSWSQWEPFKTSRSWTLNSGDGKKTVYFRTGNNSSMDQEPSSDSIVLNTTQPQATVTATPVAAATNPPTSSPPSSGSGGGGGGGGGGSTTSGEKYSNIELKEKYYLNIHKNRVSEYRFTEKKNPLLFVNITGNTNVGEIITMVEVLRNTSILVKTPPPGIVNKNLNIWVGTSSFATPKNIKQATIEFRVENSWFEKNNISSSRIVLVRWNGTEWIKLETSKKAADSTFTYYQALTNSFSPFAITALKETPNLMEKTGDQEKPPVPMHNSEQPEKVSSDFLSNWFLIIGVLLVIGIIIEIFIRMKKR